MKFSDYTRQALRTAPSAANRSTKDWNDANFAMGLAGEAGELVDLLKKRIFHDKPVEVYEIADEAGDVLWYLTMLCESNGLTLESVAKTNIDKLKDRYPEGFVEHSKANR